MGARLENRTLPRRTGCRRGTIRFMACVDLNLRLALDSDAQAIASMSRDLIEAGLGWQYRPRRVRELLADRETVTLVACERERVIGFAVMTFGEERAHLVLMAVRPTHQRRRIASRMLEWLLETAAVAGMASIHVEMREHNVPALAFYRAHGFAETRELPGYYRGREAGIRMGRAVRRYGPAPATWRMRRVDG